MKPKTAIFHVLSDIFTNLQCIENLNDTFSQSAHRLENKVKVEKYHLVAGLQLKMLNMQKVIFYFNSVTEWCFRL